MEHAVNKLILKNTNTQYTHTYTLQETIPENKK